MFHRSRPNPARLSAAALAVLAMAGGLAVVAGPIGLVGPAGAERKAPVGKDGKARTTGTVAPKANVTITATEFARAEQPIAVASRPDDPTLYIVEKPGRIKAWRDGKLDPTPVLDIVARVDSANERGLIGLAFLPTNPAVLYIDYTDKAGVVHVSEVPFDGRVADIAKERTLLTIPKPYNEHNAGTLSFDKAGLLYIAIGDGGSSGDPKGNAQRTDVLLGKILRIDPRAADGKPYAIPSANPFASGVANASAGAATSGGTGGGLGSAKKARPEILAFGLRNPWRATVDAVTGDVWVPDVGESDIEEINRIPAGTGGQNFGWSLRQGLQQFKGPRPKGAVDPVFNYPHADGRCAVVGGGVYRGAKIPALVGRYVFGDVCSGNLSVLDGNTPGQGKATDLGAHVSYLTAFGVGPDGELIAMSLEGGLYRLDPTA